MIYTTEVEYISAERKQTTGNVIVRDENGEYLFKIEKDKADPLVRAVNCYDIMLTALQAIHAHASNDDKANATIAELCRAALEKVGAIRKARGGL